MWLLNSEGHHMKLRAMVFDDNPVIRSTLGQLSSAPAKRGPFLLI